MEERLRQALVFLVLWSLGHVWARTLYVALDGADANGCGLTLQAACASLVYTIKLSQDGGVIQLSDGVYTEKGDVVQFGGASGFKELTIQSASGDPTKVTIDRAYNGRLFVFGDGVVSITFKQIKFDRGGWSTAAPDADYAGALMRFTSTNGTITFTECRFERMRNPNKGYGGRGGVGMINAGSPRFENCYFNDNWAGVASAFYINGVAQPSFKGCVFENSGCFQDGWGGVLVPEGESTATWEDCTFRNNVCDYGGAVDDGGTANPTFTRCVFEGNYARGFGGAYYGFGDTRTKFIECQFFKNRLPKGSNGQDFYLSSSVEVTFESCSFDAGPDPVFVADGASGAAKDKSKLIMHKSTVKGYRAAAGVYLIAVDAQGEFESTVFENNACSRGGVISSERPTTIRKCNFRHNNATDGGVILFGSKTAVTYIIEDSDFVENIAFNTGGAIKIIGPNTLKVTNSHFAGNSAFGAGGGAFYIASDSTVQISDSSFIENRALIGGAIWSEGTLKVQRTTFEKNALVLNNDDGGDMCGVTAGTGGAIYASSLSSMSLDGAGTCTLPRLEFVGLEFKQNAAGDGGGGAIFVDRTLPSCIKEKPQVCQDCKFTNNTASYGEDIATIANALVFRTDAIPTTWDLMVPVDISIGAVDRFGQPLRGSHLPLIVRASLNPRQALAASEVLSVRLVSNVSRIMRAGDATFKAMALQLPLEALNSIDVPLNLTFRSDLTASGGSEMILIREITLAKCPNEKGALNSDGLCLMEAKDDKQTVIAGVVFSVVLGASFAFAFYWSYKHSQRVMDTLRQLVTGVGASLIRLAFELLDVLSDITTLVNLFVYDVNLKHEKFVRAAYVTLFAISFLPSIAVMRATMENVILQWKRMHNLRKIREAMKKRRQKKVGQVPGASQMSGRSDRSDGREGEGGWTEGFSKIEHPVDKETKTNASPITPILNRSASQKWDMRALQTHIATKIETLEHDLVYHRSRAKYMQRVMIRLLAEDILLFLLNLYIYLENQSNSVFLQSQFRKTLEFSILMSAMSFGSQVQSIVAWLAANKVGEVRKELDALLQLRV
ncbi:hypothetical protein Poli38472_004744 [Pythium oligandrum]|uniref:Right handed beta helix domain-containing protein n=1 Tax=Pythium oligandrum TaxID=41045 RepID=A0A8K1CBB7_PYTOL|nr:hypothetical protein Poli38472_004744 [Pythium oligandrum]|eukprot:TMW59675.1 hypothetical protein Poli38472_004744 [Pythium oligandrum]